MKMALFRNLQYFIASATRAPFSSLTKANIHHRRRYQLFSSRAASTTLPVQEKAQVKITFVRANGERIEANGKIGDSILDVVVNNEIDLDGYGACEGTLTCSTCHLILPKEVYDKLPDKPTDEELDMLDLAYDLTDTSRLGCQIVLTKELDGLEVRVPMTINDARA